MCLKTSGVTSRILHALMDTTINAVNQVVFFSMVGRMASFFHSLLIGIVVGLLSSAAVPEDSIQIDAGKGVIDGRLAISFWPAEDSRGDDLIDPLGFEVHLVPESDLGEELTYPCGTWLQPPSAKYRFWLEGNGSISPSSSVMVWSGGAFQGKGGVVVNRVVPGGLVGLPEVRAVGSQVVLRLLHLDSHRKGPVLHREMSRRVPAGMAHQGVLMPEGPVVAALFDNDTGEYLALSRPVTLSRDRFSEARCVPPPAPKSALLVVLERPEIVAAAPEDELVVEGDQGPRPPDVLVPTAERVYGIWYELPEKHVRLKASSVESFLAAQAIVLRPGKVESYRGNLRPLPDLEVKLELPAQWSEEELTLEVQNESDGSLLRRAKLAPGSLQHRFEALPTSILRVMLAVKPWAVYEPADLSHGEDLTITLHPEPVELTGTVYLGDEGYPALVEFRTDPLHPQDFLKVETDEKGCYETLLFRTGYYAVFVRPVGREDTPFLNYTDEPIMESMVLDFHIPANRYRVRVVDAESGAGISGAEVNADNEFAYEEPELSDRKRTVSQLSVTAKDGVAQLPPLRPGELVLAVSARGYRSAEGLVEPVFENEDRDIVVELQRIVGAVPLRLSLPGGAPAAEAEVRVQHGLDSTPPLWAGGADGEGIVEIPLYADAGFLIVRHPEAGCLIRPLRITELGPDEVWTLPPAAGPMVARILRYSGEPARWAGVAMWVDGLQISGATLAWVSWARASGADVKGRWVARNLPAAPIRMLAWMGNRDTRGLSGVGDSLALTVSYPWRDVVELEAIE